jgi:hypothetical protein
MFDLCWTCGHQYCGHEDGYCGDTCKCDKFTTEPKKPYREVVNVPQRYSGMSECPECGHTSVIYTDYYPATRIDPECSAGYCKCIDNDRAGRHDCDECLAQDPCLERRAGDECTCQTCCNCRYEFG